MDESAAPPAPSPPPGVLSAQAEMRKDRPLPLLQDGRLHQFFEMYIDNDLPLVVKYNVASLGEIKLCLAPLPSSS